MPTLDYNMNMNMDYNMNMGSSGASVGGNGTRVRFNTEDYRRYVAMALGNPNEAVVPNNPENLAFPAYWDAELRAYEYLDEFLRTYPNWRQQLTADVANGVPAAFPANLTPTHRLNVVFGNNVLVRDEIIYVLDQAPDRQDRFQEILSQHSGEGAISYFLGMLMIDPSRMPAMNLLIRVARRIGEHIAMVLKGEFRCPRPSQLC